MDMKEYIEWYEEHFHMRPSQRLIEKFLSVNQPVESKTENKDNKNNKNDDQNK